MSVLDAAKDVDVGEKAGGGRVSNPNDLRGLALAAIRRAEHLQRLRVAYSREIAPEHRAHPAVVGILHHAGAPAVADELRPFAAELELVARIIDRPRPVRLHE